ncbi:unnamed protein product [Didymodactylos carnosus]|uniref:Uncharacterized protein n=1 Tax=Didymodactylos carnosus TaxID=1234261 RepID=A0A814L734_9BILA|nr:unnamed protein product [Didymodactylos carnosus]CAF3827885.1 unnamed protein product [Didymodactylos carnosus]
MGCKHSKIAVETSNNNVSTSINLQNLQTTTPVSVITNATTTTSDTQVTVFNRERVNLESHQLIWLDHNVSSNNDINTSTTFEGLGKIVAYTKLFHDIEGCLQYIERTKDTATFLVCSGKLGQALIPQIHNLKTIWLTYIYYHNKQYHQQWASNYSKVRLIMLKEIKQVYVTLEHLLNDLTQDVEEYLKHVKDGFFSDIGRKDQTIEYFFSSWETYFCNFLVHLPYPTECFKQFISIMKNYYEGNTTQVGILKEFEHDYKPDRAVWWYTRDTFLYRLMNRALRQHNIEVMFLFGFFLHDIYRQLKKEHEKFILTHIENPVVKVYRGQVMSNAEIKKLNHSSLIVNTSFFSTSLDRSSATAFLDQSSQHNDELQNILFEIEIDVRQQSRPYGNISHLSQFENENELLFMIGTQFRNDNISYIESEKIWIVKLSLIYTTDNKDNQDFKNTSNRRILKRCVNTLCDVRFMYNVSAEDVNTIFNGLMNDLYPSEKWLLAVKMGCLARKAQRNLFGFTSALSNYNEAIKIWTKFMNDDELNCSFDIGTIHEHIGGCYYHKKNNLVSAKEHYDLAISYFQSAIEKVVMDYELMNIHDKLRDVYLLKMEVSNDKEEKTENGLMVIKHKELSIQNMLKCPSSNDMKAASDMEDLAHIYRSIFRYDDSLINYAKALEIYLQHFEPDFLNIRLICEQIIKINIEYKYDYHSALRYQLLKHEYILKDCAPKSTDNEYDIDHKIVQTVKSHKELADIYILSHQYDLANENLIISLKLYNESKRSFVILEIAAVEEKLADDYIALCHYESATKHLNNAIKLYKECEWYNKDKRIAAIEEKIADIYTTVRQYDLASEHLTKAMELYQGIDWYFDKKKIVTIQEKIATIQKNIKTVQRSTTRRTYVDL